MSHAESGDPLTFSIIGAAIAVHTELGCGFLEAVYREALQMEFKSKGIPNRSEPKLPLSYRGQPLQASYRPDFICFERIIVEIKALGAITPTETSQVINYLKASRLRVGLLLNFGTPSLQSKRLILKHEQPGT